MLKNKTENQHVEKIIACHINKKIKNLAPIIKSDCISFSLLKAEGDVALFYVSAYKHGLFD